MSAISEPNKIYMKEGETLSVEPGGMLASKNLAMKTSLIAGSVLNRAKSYALGGESLFRNIYTAEKGGGWIALEEKLPGQIVTQDLHPDESALMIRRTALLASTPNVELETQYLGLTGFMKGQGIATIRASVKEGEGKVYFHATDGVVKAFHIRPEDGKVTIDNDMILAYSENLTSELARLGTGINSLVLSGEGLVNNFSGEGVVYVASGSQTGSVTLLDAANEYALDTARKLASYTARVIFVAGVTVPFATAYYFYTGNDPFAFAWRFFKKMNE